jgi:type IV pilus assembly protein PilC
VGEEAGKLPESFGFLADSLDRSNEVLSKAQHALIYPAFVIAAFIGVMVLMLTLIIPRVGAILASSGQELPLYTRMVLGLSSFLIHYGLFILIAIAIGLFFVVRSMRTEAGKLFFDGLKLSIPFIGNLYQKLFLSRMADNFSTMLLAGVPIIEAVNITATVVGNPTYESILREASDEIRGGKPMSEALNKHEEIPAIMIAMIRTGEETGELGSILIALSKFYRREVTQAIDTLLSLIEPAMILLLGLGVGILLASVLLPIYNLAGAG